jgi:DNA (cytosine-5)-methyltransferase 1
MTRPLLLDLFCKAGGASVGYHRAGFDVIGVDIEPQPHYPFLFWQADALAVLAILTKVGYYDDISLADGISLDDIDAIHASPPCQDHSSLRHVHSERHGTGWLLAATREALQRTRLPWVIENVPGAPMRADYKLCGCMFGLPRLRRERWFETNPQLFDMRPPCYHIGPAVTVCGHGAQGSYEYVDGVAPTQADRKAAMGIDWMNRDELAQAIPPAYTEFIGRQLLSHMQTNAIL